MPTTLGTATGSITLTRASTATFTGSNGLIQTAAINTPRIDYNPITLAAKGLLVEEQRTNLFLYSEDFANAAWTKSAATISSGSTESPDGTVDASKIVESATLGTHFILQSRTSTASAAHTATLFVKAAERSIIRLQLDDGSANGAFCDYNLTGTPVLTPSVFGTGSAASASATLIANGWYRCSLSCIPATTGTTVRLVAYLGNNSGVFNYTGDGTSGLNIWGAQIEAGSFATSYIPTTSASVIRSADVASVATSSFPYNQTEGSIIANISNFGDFIQDSIVEINDGTGNNRITMRYVNSTTVRMTVVVGGTTLVSITPSATPSASASKFAAAYMVGDSAACYNQSAVSTGSPASIPTVNKMDIGNNNGVTSSYLNGHILQITYFPRRISDSDLQVRTS